MDETPTQRETDDAVVDLDRQGRTGTPEVIFGPGKSVEQLISLLQALTEAHGRALATRVEPEAAERVAEALEARYQPVSRLLSTGGGPSPLRGRLAVVSGGTTDIPVAEEAAATAEWFGCDTARAWDIGVAGVHRLLDRKEWLQQMDVVIAVAGMEGALPSVVAGLVHAPVIAVPTSVGYGAHLEGITPLLAMMTSCAPGVSVVNIDNGFGAAEVAARILRGRQ